MKRLLLFLICLGVLFSASCKNTSTDGIEQFFNQTTVVFETSGVKYRYNDPDQTFLVISGDFSGMSLCFVNNECIVSFKEFRINTDPRVFPQLKEFLSLFDAYKNNADAAVINDQNAYALLIDSSRFLVYYNSDICKVHKLVADTESGSFEYKVIDSEDIN